MHALGKLVDAAVSVRMERHHYLAKGKGLFAQSDDGRTWRALWVTYTGRRYRPLCVQPFVTICCPEAFKIVSAGLGLAYGTAASRGYGKLGNAMVLKPLYALARIHCGGERTPSDYDLTNESGFAEIADLIVRDFKAVETNFLPSILTLQVLFDRIVTEPSDSGTGASLYAIALAYLLDPKMPANEIDKLTRLWPCQMTTEFAIYMKQRIASEK
jgi:hypothetical protein